MPRRTTQHATPSARPPRPPSAGPPRPRPPSRTLATGGRLALLLVALTSLFAMHGLSDHGTAGHLVTNTPPAHAGHGAHADPGIPGEGRPMSTARPVADQLDHAGPAAVRVDAVTAVGVEGAMTSGELGPPVGDGAEHPMPAGGHGAGLMGLCLAVLAAGLMLALAAVLRRRLRPLSTSAAPRLALPSLVARARDPVPPDLRRLSIQRC